MQVGARLDTHSSPEIPRCVHLSCKKTQTSEFKEYSHFTGVLGTNSINVHRTALWIDKHQSNVSTLIIDSDIFFISLGNASISIVFL